MTGRDIPSYTVAYAVETGGAVECRVKNFYFVDPQTIRQELRRQGAHPLSIRKKRKSLRDYFTRTDKSWQIRILRAIATHVSKEASPGRVLQDLISMQDDARAQFLLAPAAQMLRRGGTFVEALKATGVFDSTTLAILRAGEESRTIRDVIKYAVVHIEERG
jgi:type II secretory pathway component PulF